MSRRSLVCTVGVFLALGLGLSLEAPRTARAAEPEWAANITVIEACSCPMFCQCYFSTKPASHHGGGNRLNRQPRVCAIQSRC